MRFRRLTLDAYGPFTGSVLDLSRASGNGLHLIYGPNEAGKSSALRAIRDLLFGMPQQTPDAHLHAAASLRLSAVIERAGEELSFVRRKKRKDSLATPDDQPLEEARLARFLNGLDAASFERLFGLDHERLESGGEETLSGQGDVGEALFDAGASGRSVHRVKLALIEEAEALFKDRAQKPEINRLLGVFSEQKKRARESQHSPEKYEEQQEGVREKRREADAQRAELSRLRAEKEHALRLRNALSIVVDRDRKLGERAALGQLPALRRDIGKEREQLQLQLFEAERDARRLLQKRGEEQSKLGALPAPGRILEMSKAAAHALSTRSGAAESSINDLPKRQGEARTLRAAIERRLPRLGLGQDAESALGHALPVAEHARLQALTRESQALSLKLENTERELPDARAKVSALTALLNEARAGRVVARDALLAPELVARFDGELAEAEQAVETAHERLRQLEQERGQLEQQLQLLKGQHGVPSAALVGQARADRDARFREAQELAADPKRKALELCLPLAALAQATMHADVLADRLRSEAQRVADAEALEQRLAQQERERARQLEARQLAEEALTSVNVRWQRAAGALGQAELLPSEAARLLEEERDGWREVARQTQELSRAQAALASAETRQADAATAMAAWRSEWQKALAPLGLPESARPEEALALASELNELAAQHGELADKERRVSLIQRDIGVFEKLVKEQCDAFAPELSSLPLLEAAARLLEQHGRASERARERANIETELGRVSRELAEVEARRDELRTGLGELCREAGVADASALSQLEERVERARALDAEIAQLDAHLAEVSEGEALAVLVDEARQSDKGAVAARLLELDDAISFKEEQSRELERDVRELELGLRAYEGRDGADAAQELSVTVARLAELSSVWVRQRLAATVLERVVEQYRERHQGPVLSRAGELFKRLTLGRFARLRVGLEDTRLECVEAGSGNGLELAQLSTGTRIQLFLALKIASLEEYLKTAPPLPLVLDDVLVEWDDERARVALEVLAELSDRLQILLFTHHGRDVAAAEALGDSRIFTHHLVPRARPEAVDLGAESGRNLRDA